MPSLVFVFVFVFRVAVAKCMFDRPIALLLLNRRTHLILHAYFLLTRFSLR